MRPLEIAHYFAADGPRRPIWPEGTVEGERDAEGKFEPFMEASTSRKSQGEAKCAGLNSYTPKNQFLLSKN